MTKDLLEVRFRLEIQFQIICFLIFGKRPHIELTPPYICLSTDIKHSGSPYSEITGNTACISLIGLAARHLNTHQVAPLCPINILSNSSQYVPFLYIWLTSMVMKYLISAIDSINE
uniref:Uncharacterized protein n=1 Tax=Saccharomyces cerevisiae TaxID=4932 RepID=E9PAF3_YEASX|nr:putative protein [Saccharomyces cerevisiae]